MKVIHKILLGAVSLTAAFGSAAMAADLSDWAVAGYQEASQAGLVSYSIVSNNLKDSITREEFCELAMNLYKKLTGEVIPEPAGSPFADTDSVAVAQAYNYGIVNGTDDNTFTPDRLVTREEMSKMLVSTLTASEVEFNIADGAEVGYIDSFDDGRSVSSWAMSSVNTALSYGLITGVTDTTLEPLSATSREQAIVSVNRSLSKFSSTGYDLAAMPTINLPQSGEEITDQSFDVTWSGCADAVSYHVIIKNDGGEAVYLKDVDGESLTVTNSVLANGGYSVTVGAITADGSEIYSLPVDFTYAYSNNTTVASTYTSTDPEIQAVLNLAASYLGTPYLWGGTTPSGFDCSGFVQYVYSHCGYSITRTTYTQWDNDGVFVSKSELRPGDLVYFGSGSSPSHVGLYVGDGTMIHAPKTGDVVKYSSIETGYYESCYLGAKRIIQ